MILEQHQIDIQQNRSCNQYVLFGDFPLESFSRLDEDPSWSSTLKSCRLTYNCKTNLLQVKIIPNAAHHLAAGMFKFRINRQLDAMNLFDKVDLLGSTTCELGSTWRKQPDCMWAFASQDTNLILVAEIGFPESRSKLAIDARV